MGESESQKSEIEQEKKKRDWTAKKKKKKKDGEKKNYGVVIRRGKKKNRSDKWKQLIKCPQRPKIDPPPYEE